MDHLSIDRRTRIQQLLLGRQRAVLDDVRAQRPFQEDAGTVSEGHGDLGDESVASMLKDVRILESERDLVELSAIERALSRIDDGTYSTCEECGAEIGYERLKAQPIATHCIDCQRRREHTYWQRPVSSL